MTHTPGPWHYEARPNSWSPSVTEYHIYSGPREDPVKIIAGTLDEDHARLITQAPAMLTELNYLDSIAPVEADYQDWHDDDLVKLVITVKALRDLRAVIAQATAPA